MPLRLESETKVLTLCLTWSYPVSIRRVTRFIPSDVYRPPPVAWDMRNPSNAAERIRQEGPPSHRTLGENCMCWSRPSPILECWITQGSTTSGTLRATRYHRGCMTQRVAVGGRDTQEQKAGRCDLPGLRAGTPKLARW